MPRTQQTKKKKKDPNAPKKPLTAYMLFSNQMREKVKQDNPNITFPDVGKELGRLWKETTDKEKYEKLAQEGKVRYKKEYEAYKETKSSSSEEEEAPKKKKKKKDPNAPKGKLSGYMIFSRDIRADIKEEFPNATFGETGKHIGEKWRDLSESEKKKYSKLAEIDKERWEKETAAYGKSSDGHKEKEKTPKKKKGKENEKEKEKEKEKESSSSSDSSSSSESGED